MLIFLTGGRQDQISDFLRVGDERYMARFHLNRFCLHPVRKIALQFGGRCPVLGGNRVPGQFDLPSCLGRFRAEERYGDPSLHSIEAARLGRIEVKRKPKSNVSCWFAFRFSSGKLRPDDGNNFGEFRGLTALTNSLR